MNLITLAAATGNGDAGQAGGGLASLMPLLMLVLMFGVLYFFMIRPQKKNLFIVCIVVNGKVLLNSRTNDFLL